MYSWRYLERNMIYDNLRLAGIFSQEVVAYINVFGVRVRHWVLRKSHSLVMLKKYRKTGHTSNR